jgi:hypothetical protein
MPKNSWRKFHGWLANREIRERFLPQKFPAMWHFYGVCAFFYNNITILAAVMLLDK